MRGSMSPSVIRLATISSTNRYRSMYLMIAGAEAWGGYSLSRNNLERLSPSGGCNNSSRVSFSYDQLKRIGDWHLTEEAQRSALAAIGKRNRGPRHLLTLGRRQDCGKRRTTVLAAASRSPADLQHPIQRLR